MADTVPDAEYSDVWGTTSSTPGTELERTLVGTLVPGAPITIKGIDWSFTAAELVAAAPVIDALEHGVHGADACVVAWLYARI